MHAVSWPGGRGRGSLLTGYHGDWRALFRTLTFHITAIGRDTVPLHLFSVLNQYGSAITTVSDLPVSDQHEIVRLSAVHADLVTVLGMLMITHNNELD